MPFFSLDSFARAAEYGRRERRGRDCMQPHYVRSRDGEGEEKRDHYYYTVPTTVHVLLHTPPSPSPSGGVEWKRGGGGGWMGVVIGTPIFTR